MLNRVPEDDDSSLLHLLNVVEDKQEDAKPEDAYQGLQAHIKQLEAQFIEQLEKMLDPDVYEAIFVAAETDKEGRYVLDNGKGKDKAIFYYQGILNLLRDAQKFLVPVSAVHQSALELMKKGIIGRAMSVPALNAQITVVLEAYAHLYQSVDILKLHQDIPPLFSTNEIIKKCRQALYLIFPIQTVVKQYQRNPLASTFKNQADSIKRLLSIEPAAAALKASAVKQGQADALVDISDNLLSLQKALENILVELIGRDVSRDSLQSVVKTNALVHKVLERVKAFSMAPRSLSAIISLVRDVYPMANELSTHFPQSYLAANKSLRNDILVVAQQLNIILREFFLQLDRLETQYSLKETYLFSLGGVEKRNNDKFFIKIAKEFNDWVEGMNCEFAANERFPYTEAILKQREKTMARYQAQPYLGGAYRMARIDLFLKGRVTSAKQKLAQEAAAAAVKKQEEQTTEFSRLEGYQLKFCQGENGSPHVDDLLPLTLHVYLKEGALYGQVKKGSVVEELPLESYRAKLIYGEGVRLKPEKLVPNKLYLYLENDALQCVVKKGHKVVALSLENLTQEAVGALRATLKDPLLPPLSAEQEKVIHQLAAQHGCHLGGGLSEDVVAGLSAALQSAAPLEQAEFEPYRQAIFGVVAPKGYTPLVTKKETIIALIDSRIAELTREMQSAWFLLTKTKAKKKNLLQALKAQVDTSFGQPSAFEQATLQQKLVDAGDLDLLFEGRTGEMLKQFRYLAARRTDEATFIQDRMTQLDTKKQRGFWFFAARRTKQLADRIEALKLLKQWLSTPGYRLDDALEVIKVGHLPAFNLLIKNDQALIDELRRLEKLLPDSEIGRRLVQPLKMTNPAQIETKLQLISDYQAILQQQKQAILNNAGFFNFLDAYRIKRLEKRIAALDTLKTWLNKQGYHLDNALLAIEFSHAEDYSFLQDEIALLKGIEEIEKKPVASRLLAYKLQMVTDYQELLKVQKQAAADGSLGFFGSSEPELQRRIDALEQLKILLNYPHHNVDYALLEIETSHAADYALIVKEEALLTRIREFEAEPVIPQAPAPAP